MSLASDASIVKSTRLLGDDFGLLASAVAAAAVDDAVAVAATGDLVVVVVVVAAGVDAAVDIRTAGEVAFSGSAAAAVVVVAAAVVSSRFGADKGVVAASEALLIFPQSRWAFSSYREENALVPRLTKYEFTSSWNPNTNHFLSWFLIGVFFTKNIVNGVSMKGSH